MVNRYALPKLLIAVIVVSVSCLLAQGDLLKYEFSTTVSSADTNGGNIVVADTCEFIFVVDDTTGVGTAPRAYTIQSGSIVFQRGYTITLTGGLVQIYDNTYLGTSDAFLIDSPPGLKPDLNGQTMDAGYPYMLIFDTTATWFAGEAVPTVTGLGNFAGTDGPNWDFRWGGNATRVRAIGDPLTKAKVTNLSTPPPAPDPEPAPEPEPGDENTYVRTLRERIRSFVLSTFE